MTKHLGKLKEKQATGILVSKTTWNYIGFVPENYHINESSKNRNKLNISLLQQTCEFRGSTVNFLIAAKTSQQASSVDARSSWREIQIGLD